jgi:ABC-type antimicrobial peptide transport system permease subunit
LRLALGARPFDVGRLVIRHGAIPIAAGLAFGAIAAFLASRAIQAQFFGVTAVDPITGGFVVLVVMLTGALACAAPARRAIRIDPALTLRD